MAIEATETKKARLSLDLEPSLKQRLKKAAAIQGVSMRQYCQAAIDKQLCEDEARGFRRGLNLKAMERHWALERKITSGKRFPGNSADLIREAREIGGRDL